MSSTQCRPFSIPQWPRTNWPARSAFSNSWLLRKYARSFDVFCWVCRSRSTITIDSRPFQRFRSLIQSISVLVHTRRTSSRPCSEHAERRDDNALRTEIEEGHRQLKCFWELAKLTARCFSLVLSQLIFVILTANLLQVFLRKHQADHPERQRRTRTRALQLLVPTATVIMIYCQNRFATLTTLEYSELLLTLSEPSRLKILDKTRRLRRNLDQHLKLARPP
jgi:hypothetical protein